MIATNSAAARAASAGADLPQPDRQRQQRAPKVAAVDRRDVRGREGYQRPRVVPVQQVTLVPFQAFDRGQRRIDLPSIPRRR